MIAHGFRYGGAVDGPARVTFGVRVRLHRTVKDHPRGVPEHASAYRPFRTAFVGLRRAWWLQLRTSSKGRNQRPGLDALLKDASRGRFNVVVVWALDRLGRSLIDLLDTLNELDAAAVTGAFAEFERGMIRCLVMAGLERARARGVRLGRPRTGAKVEAAVRARVAVGDGIKKVAKAVGVGNGTVSRIKAAMTS
jgi:DNA invertase Pin-like site-specific DNA recombinase